MVLSIFEYFQGLLILMVRYEIFDSPRVDVFLDIARYAPCNITEISGALKQMVDEEGMRCVGTLW